MLIVAQLFALVSSSAALFPRADIAPAPRAPDGRNAAMGTLVKNLIAQSGDEDACAALLDEATPMLMSPFIGIPEPGSVYDGMNGMQEKADAYRSAVAQRVAKADEQTGAALSLLAGHVLACVAAELAKEDGRATDESSTAEAIARLRGGGRGNVLSNTREWERTVDSALDKAENCISQLRSSLRPREAFRVTNGDAAFAGFACGFAVGSVFIGDPFILGIGIGGTFAFANANPEKFVSGRGRQVANVAHRAGMVVRRARARL